MKTDLHAALAELSRMGADEAQIDAQLHAKVIERVRSKRRRRPRLIAGVTVTTLLASGGAYAAFRHLEDSPGTTIPDVIVTDTPPRPTPSPTGEGDPTGTPETSALATAVPGASFPECGAIVDLSVGGQGITLYGANSNSAVSASSDGGSALRGTMAAPVQALVKDGVVVGSASTGPQVGPTPFDMPRIWPGVQSDTGGLPLTSCASGASAPLPAGGYSIWAYQEFAVTEQVQYDENYVPQPPEHVQQTYVAFDKVGNVWLDESGAQTSAPGIPEGWPTSVPQAVAFAGQVNPRTVVWLAAAQTASDTRSAAYIDAEDRVFNLGYEDEDMPFRCQPGTIDALGLVEEFETEPWGVGVIFASKDEAQDFASRWEALYGPVVAVVEADVFCDFD